MLREVRSLRWCVMAWAAAVMQGFIPPQLDPWRFLPQICTPAAGAAAFTGCKAGRENVVGERSRVGSLPSLLRGALVLSQAEGASLIPEPSISLYNIPLATLGGCHASQPCCLPGSGRSHMGPAMKRCPGLTPVPLRAWTCLGAWDVKGQP